ncbi:MAG: FkbM family methyltransferase [Candidatus Brocadiia bacterium]
MKAFVLDSEEFQRELRCHPHEAGEIEFLRSVLRPGMRVIEVGANKGVTSVAIAEAIGREGHLHAFEPVPEFYDELRCNLVRNETRNVSTHRLALGDRSGQVSFYKHGEGSGVAPIDHAAVLHVKATTIDDFMAGQSDDRVDFLNLDCEGSELLVLRGAGRILERYSPGIFCEVHHGYLEQLGQSAGDIVDLLTDLGYVIRFLQVEDLDAEPAADGCSHLYAWKGKGEKRVQEIRRRLKDLKTRMPAHSVKASMVQELEELEEQLKEARALRDGGARTA